MRALSSLLLAGAVGLGGLVMTPATAEADGGGWRGRNYYRHYAPPPPAYGGYGLSHGPRPYYRPPPPVYYRPPPPAYYAPPPAYYAPPPPAFYGPPPGFYAPRSYGIPPGPGVGLWIR